MTKSNIAEVLGECLMHDVRDQTIQDADGFLYGTIGGDIAKAIREALSKVSTPEEGAALIIPIVADLTLHYFLNFLEESPRFVFSVSLDDGEVVDMSKISDGLAGEIYTSKGWIHRFSQERSLGVFQGE